ncbi:MAG TPA: hypothetical protein DCP68_08145 [Ruminococcus sp.]|nr:hypothetical protein [Ruminococcus sp.]
MYWGCIIPLNLPARIFQHKAEHLPDDLHIRPYNALDFSHIRRKIRRSCAVSVGRLVRYLRYIAACSECGNIAESSISHSSAPDCRRTRDTIPAQKVMHSCLPDMQNVSGLYHFAECAGADFSAQSRAFTG